jgi:hypothetical protein
VGFYQIGKFLIFFNKDFHIAFFSVQCGEYWLIKGKIFGKDATRVLTGLNGK